MNKKVMAIVAVIALVAILGICLVACNAQSVSKKLKGKDYSVAALSDKSSGVGSTVYGVVKGIEGFKEGLVAAKGTDSVVVVWFDNTDSAKKLENSKVITTFAKKVSRVGKVVYIGTEQGVKDAM